MIPNRQRWRYGDTNPVVTKAVPSATVIEVGDIVGQAVNGDPYPASAETWDTNIGTTQANFAPKFLGVSGSRSRNGDADPIRVCTTGVFEFDCAAATFEIGALVGPAKQTGNAIESQKVVAVADENKAIGRVVKRYGTNTTRVLVAIGSAVVGNGHYPHVSEIEDAIANA